MKPLILCIPIVLAAALAQAGQPLPAEFDNRGNAVYEGYGRMNEAYRAGGSTERTLQEYYSRRQYPGSPPYIPHPAEEVFDEEIQCLSCHSAGGWVEEYKRHAPVTPHPEKTSCRQCHILAGHGRAFQGNGLDERAAAPAGGVRPPGFAASRSAPPPDARELSRLPRRPGGSDVNPVGARRERQLQAVPCAAEDG